ncbi:MAG: ATP-binding protein [Kiritimatiellae bacterium]|nr:ATP-binding protein [Kiritimatiellia bacterium]
MADYNTVLKNQKEDLGELLKADVLVRERMSGIDLASPCAQVVIGVRRSGKSILCLTALKTAGVPFGYVTFDDEKLDGIEAADLDEILKAVYVVYGPVKHLFLDEIQDAPKWQLFVNRLLRKGLRVVISGSNARLLSSELATYLTGRFVSTELFPFSFAEYRAYMKRGRPETTKGKAEARRDYEHYALHGGMPETFHMIDARGYLRDIYNAILFRDILKRHKLRNPQTLSDISRVLMESYALEVSYANIANRLGIKSVHTVQTYANYLEAAYLIQTVNRFSFKTAERLKLGKVYCIDPGFVSYASGVLEGAENRGRRLENIVFLQLRSLREKLDYEIYYYRDQSHEVDFVLRHFGKVKRLVQVCWDISDEKTRKRELSALFEVGRKLKCADLLLVTDHEDEIVNEGSETVRVVNVVDWLLAAPLEETPNWGQCASAETGVKTCMP